jgi:hypothetical protein
MMHYEPWQHLDHRAKSKSNTRLSGITISNFTFGTKPKVSPQNESQRRESLRYAPVRQRAGYRCEYCCLPQNAEPFFAYHVEHIVARQHRGRDRPVRDRAGWP